MEKECRVGEPVSMTIVLPDKSRVGLGQQIHWRLLSEEDVFADPNGGSVFVEESDDRLVVRILFTPKVAGLFTIKLVGSKYRIRVARVYRAVEPASGSPVNHLLARSGLLPGRLSRNFPTFVEEFRSGTPSKGETEEAVFDDSGSASRGHVGWPMYVVVFCLLAALGCFLTFILLFQPLPVLPS